ncbi:hypothetical protein QEN19_002425 [Hanseniaspora menglaensis]
MSPSDFLPVKAENLEINNENHNLKYNLKLSSDIKSTSALGANHKDDYKADNDKERYSCQSCRQYKKRCTKEKPACVRCIEKGLEKECFYPGKHRRRTKVEMMVEKEKGYSSLHKSPGVIKLRSENNNSDISNERKQENIISAINSSELESENPYSQLSLERVTPIIGLELNSHPATSVYLKEPSRSFMQPISTDISTTPFNNEKSDLKVYSNFGSDVSTTTNFDSNTKQCSISITAANIQYEAVSAMFKGGQQNPIKEFEISKSLVSKAITGYFRHNHRTYPMIHKLKFTQRVGEIQNFNELEEITPNDEYETFKFMLYFMLAIGTTTLQRAGNLEKNLFGVDEYFAYLAMKRFKIVMKYQNLDTIRALILLGVYSFFEPKGISSWTIGGIICRLCIGLGLNKQLVGKKKLAHHGEHLELRNRCYWSAYCFEKLVHLSLLRGDGGLDVNDSDVPFPKALYPEEEDDIRVNIMMINLRVLENKIFQSLHTIKASNKFKNTSLDKRLELLNTLQQELDSTFQKYKSEFKSYNSSGDGGNGDVSFHRSELWLVMRYEQFQILLYRPSKVFPRLPATILTKLGNVCLSSLRHSYMLYQQKKMPFNWVTLFRTLNVCNATCVCLYNWSIDLNDCEREFKQIIEVLSNFGSKWHAAKTFAKVFKNISESLLQFSLHVNENNEEQLQQLNFQLFGPNSEYYDIMDENDVDISWLDFIKE